MSTRSSSTPRNFVVRFATRFFFNLGNTEVWDPAAGFAFLTTDRAGATYSGAATRARFMKFKASSSTVGTRTSRGVEGSAGRGRTVGL